MKKIMTLLSVLMILSLCVCTTAFAETTPLENIAPTEDVFATEEPVYTEVPFETEVVDDPTYPEETTSFEEDTYPSEYTEPYTGEETASTEYTDPTGSTEITTEVIQTNPPEPTEPDEDSTYSDYVSPAPVYTPADQDFQAKDWKEIELNLEADPAPGKQSFINMQNDKTKGNDSIAGFLIVGIVLIFLSLALFTFVIIYRPFKKKAKACGGARYANQTKEAPKRAQRKPSVDNRKPFNPDDYNDGF